MAVHTHHNFSSREYLKTRPEIIVDMNSEQSGQPVH